MTKAATQGTVYTFYSFKGGVGRTMALANVAALLAKWGHSVLVVDWDLEAPGIERFFLKDKEQAKTLRVSQPGIVDLVMAKASGKPIEWQRCVHGINLNGSPHPISLITAGQGNGEYVGNLQKLNFSELFVNSDLGVYIESLRDEWTSKFDFVLVDSRTGVTDIGGICTVLLADVLVLLFTTTDSSTDGVLDVVRRAREAQQHLPRDRQRLVAVPVPARDESRTEYALAKKWRETVAEKFSELYKDWLPADVTPHDALELLKIPYVPFWSFGELLPAIEEGTGDPSSLGFSYEILAKLIASKLDWEVVKGRSSTTLANREIRTPDPNWLKSNRNRSGSPDLSSRSGEDSRIEIYHYCIDVHIQRDVKQLRQAAMEAMTTSGSPTGRVTDNESPPRPIGDFIATLPQSKGSACWTLNGQGDFYELRPFYQEDRDKLRNVQAGTVLFADLKISEVTEALLHAAKLYRLLAIPPDARIQFNIGYWGIGGRTLVFHDAPTYLIAKSAISNHQIASIEFVLNTFEGNAIKLVKEICRPLFLQFDFAEISDQDYERGVTGVLQAVS